MVGHYPINSDKNISASLFFLYYRHVRLCVISNSGYFYKKAGDAFYFPHFKYSRKISILDVVKAKKGYNYNA